MKHVYYLSMFFLAFAFTSCYTTTPKYLYASNTANLLPIEKKGDVKAAVNFAQTKHVGKNDDTPGRESSNGIDVQTAYSPINHLVVKADVFKKWEVDKSRNNDASNQSRYRLNYQRQGTAFSIGYYKFLDKRNEILFNIDGGIGFGKTSFNGTYRLNPITKYYYSANHTNLSVTPSLKFKLSENVNLNLTYRLSSAAFSKINTNDSSLTKGLYAAFANKNSVYGDMIISSDFGFNSLHDIRFHWQLGISRLFTHFNYVFTPSYTETFADQYEYNNLFAAIGIITDLKKLLRNKK